MAIKYVAYDQQGQEVKGILEVADNQAAEEILWQSNLTIVSLHKERAPLNLYELFPTIFGVKKPHLILFTRQLAELLKSGISLLPAIAALQTQVESPIFKNVLTKITQDIQQGNLFSQACEKHPEVFPEFYRRLMQVGEATGRLDLILSRLSTYMEKDEQLSSKVKQSLAYPAFVLGLGVVSAIILLTFSLPAMVGLFKEWGAELPLPTRILVGVASFLQEWGLIFFSVIIMFIILGFFYGRTPAGQRRFYSFLTKVPLVKGAVAKNQMARFSSIAHTLMASGLPLTEVMDLAISSTANLSVREALGRVKAKLLTGETLSQSLSVEPVFSPIFVQMVSVGEQTGNLVDNLSSLTVFYETEADRAMTRLTGMIGPFLIIMVGLMVGFVAVSVITPMYSIIGQIK